MFKISQKQAQEFAISIYSSILPYVNANKAEFEVFLANEITKNKGLTYKKIESEAKRE